MNVTIPDGWTATELTLSANQLWADWSKKQFKWQEQTSTCEVSEPNNNIENNEFENFKNLKPLIRRNLK